MSKALTAEKSNDVHAFSGSGALAVTPERSTGSSPATVPRPRTALSLVPAMPARRRVPFAVFSLLILVAALATVLMLNISVSGTQYDLVQLRNQQVALSQQNEALVLEIEGREAPQNLAAAATELGMVSSPTFGTIELDSMKVTGTPEPATEGPEPEVLIAAPKLGTGAMAAADAPAETEAAEADAPGEPAEGTRSASETIPGPQQPESDR